MKKLLLIIALISLASFANAQTPTVGITAAPNPVCKGDSTILAASGATTYVWSGGLGTANPIKVAPTDTTTYTVTGTTTGGTGTASIKINVNPLPDTFFFGSHLACAGGPVTIDFTAGMTNYCWSVMGGIIISGGTATSNTITVIWITGGLHSIYVNCTNSYGCSFETPIVFDVFVDTLSQTTPVITVHGDSLFSNFTSGNQWYNTDSLINGANDNIYVPLVTGNYFDIISDTNGCKSDTSNKIHIAITGLADLTYNNNIYIYPNPAINNITIETHQKSIMEIINIQGQTILQQQLQQGKTDIEISALAKGVYILRLCSNDKTAVTRIVKE